MASKWFVFTFFFCLHLGSQAQIDLMPALSEVSEHTLSLAPAEEGKVHFEVSTEMADYIALMDSIDAKTMKTEGYRIQVFSASGSMAKETTFKQQSEFLQLYDKTPSYTMWSYPNWVLRVGDFRTRLEALEFHEVIRAKYPASFIIKDEIDVGY